VVVGCRERAQPVKHKHNYQAATQKQKQRSSPRREGLRDAFDRPSQFANGREVLREPSPSHVSGRGRQRRRERRGRRERRSGAAAQSWVEMDARVHRDTRTRIGANRTVPAEAALRPLVLRVVPVMHGAGESIAETAHIVGSPFTATEAVSGGSQC
jgi:hypothetical protein